MSRSSGPLALAAVLLAGAGCSDQPGCLDGDLDTCLPASPCEGLVWECEDGFVRAYRLSDPALRPPGLDALAAVGDYVLENDRLLAVIDAPETPHYLATSGGSLLDLAPKGGGDHLNQAYQITGILPRDAPEYRTAEIRVGAGWAAVIVRGALRGDPRAEVVTRYELRPCDRGVRIRTEAYNGGHDPGGWFLADAFYWGDRGMTPFVPLAGEGFVHPELDLVEIDRAWRRFPWMAAQSHAPPHASYAVLACDRASLEGVDDSNVTAAGTPRTVVPPGDGLAFDRVVLAAPGPGLGGAQALALEARGRLFGERVIRASGRVPAGAGGDERRASLLFEELGGEPVPWTEVVPDADGAFVAHLPPDRRYRVTVHRLGRPVGVPIEIDVRTGNVDLGEIAVPPPATLVVRAVEAESDSPLDPEVVLVPTGETRPEDVDGSLHGLFGAGCAPFLGNPHGPSPACNRVLLDGGVASVAAPAGTYLLLGTLGPEWTLARAEVTLRDGQTTEALLELARLDLRPAGALAADFHVHGARSFDSSIPDEDRVRSFLSAGLDVLAATDHDVVASYEEAIAALGVGDRIRVLPGVEQTAMVPWLYPPGSDLPLVIGHFNFWPVEYDPSRPRNGAPWDELLEPGALFDRMRPLVGDRGVMQLNHPVEKSLFGRDQGYVSMLGLDIDEPLPMRDDGTAAGMLFAAPAGGHRNVDHDVQEVMNGPEVLKFVKYRALWFAFLDHGIVRGGTANSDSHGLLVDAPVGWPRTFVLGAPPLADFDPDAFDDAVRAGRMFGTNGPMIEAWIDDGGERLGYGTEPVSAGVEATLRVTVLAAPWIPVEEIRIVVNGDVAATAEPPSVEIPLADLPLGGRDGWIVVEAGMRLPASADTDGDGFADRIDADGDGLAEEKEIERAEEGDARFDYDAIAPHSWPTSFTNPFLLDVDGNGWEPDPP